MRLIELFSEGIGSSTITKKTKRGLRIQSLDVIANLPQMRRKIEPPKIKSVHQLATAKGRPNKYQKSKKQKEKEQPED